MATPATAPDPDAPLRIRLGALLRELRGDTSQSEQARKLGISRPWLAKIEAGRANATLDLLEQIGPHYDVSFAIVARPRAGG